MTKGQIIQNHILFFAYFFLLQFNFFFCIWLIKSIIKALHRMLTVNIAPRGYGH